MMHRVFLLALLIVCTVQMSAQTIFIPDVNLRTWLNNAKPNSVDVNGYCDTASWNAQPPNTVNGLMNQLPNGTVVDLEGIQYLKVQKLFFQSGLSNSISINWPGYPIGIQDLDIRFCDVNLFTGAFLPFPPSVDFLQCQTCGFGTLPPFSGTEMWFYQEDLGGQVLTVPPSVTSLLMVECNLSTLPPLSNLDYLNVDDNPLGSLPALPAGLVALQARNTGLSSVPALPASLSSLALDDNAIIALPAIPANLQELSLSRNQLSSLPALPLALNLLDVAYNPMPVLPQLGPFIRTLNVDSCGMSMINYPLGLRTLTARYNPITVLPPFGGAFQSCDVRDCPQLSCLPGLPNTTYSVRLAGSGITCLPNLPPDLNTTLNTLGIAPVVCNVGTSPCPPAYPLITGTSFLDDNGDGVYDPWEVVRPNRLVIAQPGDLLTASDMNGDYVLPADSGSFTVTGVPGLYEPVTTAPYAVSLSNVGDVDSLNHVGFFWVPGMYDLVTTITATDVRPGFNSSLWVTVNNVGTEPTTATLQLTFDVALTYNSSSVAPTSVNGNVVEWTSPLLLPGEQWTVLVGLYGPPSLVLGSPLVHQATATPLVVDQTPADNTYVLNDVVVGSFDPNDKRVEPEMLMLSEVLSSTPVHYTVRFQNTGTYPAERVLITDTLPGGLQLTSMQFDASSHACHWYIHHGVLHVFYENINLPDSTSDEPNSHGFVRFTFIPQTTLQVGEVVANVANIYFDYNEPVITNAAYFGVETMTGMVDPPVGEVQLWPNPAMSTVHLRADRPLRGTVDLMDLTGRMVLRERATGVQQTLDVSSLAGGAYMLRCTTEDGQQSVRFVKH